MSTRLDQPATMPKLRPTPKRPRATKTAARRFAAAARKRDRRHRKRDRQRSGGKRRIRALDRKRAGHVTLVDPKNPSTVGAP